MNGFILLPSFYSHRHTDNYKILFKMMSDELGFKVHYGKASAIPKNVDVVIVYSIPHHNLKGYNLKPLLDLPNRIKIIGFPRDLQCYGKSDCEERKKLMFERYDIILSYYHEFFVENHAEYVHKFRYIPQWFASHERYVDLGFNKTPEMKCLLSGTMGKVYPLRTSICRHSKQPFIATRGTNWGRANGIIKERYAKMLHSYYCCATCGSKFDMVLAKHLEIPATGSLLICNQTNDLTRTGFVPDKHYVSITKDNAIDKIKECLENREKYDLIRKRGMRFVHRNHSILNRFEELKKIIDEI